MSAVTKEQQIINDFENYIRQKGGGYSAWYCGVASDPKSRLFNDHNVDKNNGAWIHSGDAGNDQTARNVEDYFLKKGCKGGGGGGDGSTRYVYAYKITSTTRE